MSPLPGGQWKYTNVSDDHDNESVNTSEEQHLRANVEGLRYQDQSFLALFFLTWISPLLSLGGKYNITATDLPIPPPNSTTPYVVNRFTGSWSDAVYKNQNDVFTANKQSFPENLPRSQQNRLHSFDDFPAAIKKRKNTPLTQHPALFRDKDNYDNNADRITKEQSPQSPMITILTMFKHPVIVSAFGEILYYLFSLFQPYLVKLLSIFFADYQNGNDQGIAFGTLIAVLLGLCTLFNTVANLIRHHWQIHLSTRVSVSFLYSIFDKSLRIAPYALAADPKLSNGAVANMVSADSNVIYTLAIFIHFIWSGTFAIVICLILMWSDLGGPTTIATGIMMASLVPIQLLIASLQRFFKKKTLQLTDSRIKLETQLINGIRVIKAYAYELILRKKIELLRDAELSQHRIGMVVTWCATLITTIYPLIVTFVAVVTYVTYTSENFSPNIIFLLLTYLNVLRLPISYLSNSVSAYVEFHVAMQRLSNYLSKEELPIRQHVMEQLLLDQENGLHLSDAHYINMMPISSRECVNEITDDTTSTTPPPNPLKEDHTDKAIIKFNQVDLYWSSFEQKPYQIPVLSNVSLTINSGERVILISGQGVGKTALLNAIVGDLYPQSHKRYDGLYNIGNISSNNRTGTFSFNNNIDIIPTDLIQIGVLNSDKLNTNTNIAYCAQQPFLLTDTIRNNIILNSPLNPELYDRVIEASVLSPDLNILKDGDLTLCGDGVGLSGGQQARVAFARMLYQSLHNNITIAICDDIFAAVDAHVAKMMFFKGIVQLLKGHTVILSLNSHYDFLQHTDKILLLDTMYTDDGYYYKIHQSVMNHYASDAAKNMASGSDDYGTDINNLAQKPQPFDSTISAPVSSSCASTSNYSVYNSAQVAAMQVGIDDTGFRQPSGIIFFGSFDELMQFNHPLLQTFTFSSTAHKDFVAFSESLANSTHHNNKQKKFGEIDAQREKDVQQRLTYKVETVATDFTRKSVSPSQSKLPASLYFDYFRGSRGKIGLWVVLGLFIFFSLASTVMRTATDWWLVQWANDNTLPIAEQKSTGYWLEISILFLVISTLLFFGQLIVFIYLAVDASKFFHEQLLEKVFHSSTAFLDTTPMGTLLTLITKDTEVLDSLLPANMIYCLMQLFQMIGVIVVALFTSFWFILLFIPISIAIYFLWYNFHHTSVQVKRIEIAAIAPLHGLFNSTLRGTTSLRAYGLQEEYITKYRKLVDNYVRAKFTGLTLERRFGFFLNCLASLYILLLAVLVVIFRSYIDSSLAMLAVSYSLRLIGVLQIFLRFFTQTTQSFTSIQRITNLKKIPQESFLTDFLTKKEIKKLQPNSFKEISLLDKDQCHSVQPVTRDGRLIDIDYDRRHKRDLYHWPWEGKIEFKNLTMRYRPELPIVLNNVSLQIQPRESVGVCGSTGSGKSTVVGSLFRFMQPSAGSIEIDGVDISMLGTGDLRSRLALVPQFPTLFSGTVRDNIDVCTRYTDAQIWHTLELVSMDTTIRQLDDGLYSNVEENGSNFSSSQRQLLCIARALLTQLNSTESNKTLGGSILVGDEVTAACDLLSDDVIQSTIRSSFGHSTKIIIAHRLWSIIDLDKVLVLRKLTEDDIAANVSSVAEFGVPYILLNDPKSTFYAMCIATGVDGFINLYNRAKFAFDLIKKRQLEEYGVTIKDPPHLIDLDVIFS